MAAEKSAGPYVRVSRRSLAKAISSARMRPSASSICASIPIRPIGRPCVVSSCSSARSTNATSPALRTLGTMMQSRRSPAPPTTSPRSSKANWLVTWLIRTTRVLPCQSCVCNASTTLARAAGFSSGAQASSRSRNTSSAALLAAFSIMRGLLPGTARTDRRRRAGICPPRARSRSRAIRLGTRLGGPVVGRDLAILRRRGRVLAAEHAAEHSLHVLRSAQVVLHALEQSRHQLLQLRVLRQLLLQASELGHEVLDRDLLGDLHQHRLRRRSDHHLDLLPDHLEPAACEACALVLAATQLCLELVECRVERTQIHSAYVIAHNRDRSRPRQSVALLEQEGFAVTGGL